MRYFYSISTQLLWLVILAIPVASIAWTVTHEDVFREPREYCNDRNESSPGLWQRKFFYLFTCEYCFSHYVTVIFLVITRFKLLYPDWRGYLVSLFAVAWMPNLYMSFFRTSDSIFITSESTSSQRTWTFNQNKSSDARSGRPDG